VRLSILLLISCFPFYALQAQQQYKFINLNADLGLSHNQVNCIIKDKNGFLWFGTVSGLNRFDGYSFKVFRNQPADSTSIHSNEVFRLYIAPNGKMLVQAGTNLGYFDPEKEIFYPDAQAIFDQYKIPSGNLNDVVEHQEKYWFLHSSLGVYIIDSAGMQTHLQHDQRDVKTISSNMITALAPDPRSNTYWLMNASGVSEQLAWRNNNYEVIYRTDFLKQFNNDQTLDYRAMIDADGDLWVYAANKDQGVFYFSTTTKEWLHIDAGQGKARLNTNIVRGLVQDNSGQIWVGTDHGGINIINKKDLSVSYVLHNEEDRKSLAQNSINTLYKDNQGIVWVGTFKKGVSYYNENIFRFPVYKNFPSDRSSLPYEDVNRFVEDDLGNLWIGTNGGGLIYFDRKKNTFKQYRHDPKDPNSISADVIVSLCIDHEKKLWIGTYYGGLNSFDGKKFIHYAHRPSDPQSISDMSVWEIFEDSGNRLWIGTLNKGLDLFDRRTNAFTHFKPEDQNSVQTHYIAAIMEDRQGNIWLGTDYGIDMLEKQNGRFIHYANEPGNSLSLSNNRVLDLKEDLNGKIWIGTQGGLNIFNPLDRSFSTFTETDGLPHNSILTIVNDNSGSLWLGTPNGISHMVYTIGSSEKVEPLFKNYNESDGLPGNQFNENAAYHTRAGELIFGSANGFTIFKPENLGVNTFKPQVVLSDFQLFNKSIHANEEVDGRILLDRSITYAPPITLPHNENVFSIGFSALNYFQPEKSEYKYKLEGFNTDWLSTNGQSRTVTFTNLDAGDYVFRVIASNNDGVWNDEGARVKITVLPPFWQTPAAFAIYALTVILTLIVVRKIIQQREQMKYAIQRERQEALHMHEVDMMKIKFFTNVSHEFRTPLTLILTPLDKLLKLSNDQSQREHFELIQRNAKRLLNLVNQLLDFRKVEVHELRVLPSEGDIVKFIRDSVYSFSDLSEKKEITLHFQSSLTSLEAIFDADKLDKILFNLLSNAFKFTPEHGRVTVTLDEAQPGWIQLEVIDSGIGIAEEEQDKIFNRFYQVDLPDSIINQGSGIGLSITREFVKVLGGSIQVRSETGQGSCFTVSLPIQEITRDTISEPDEALLSNEKETFHDQQRSMVLLIEDNSDFRTYLKESLRQNYQIIEAANGQEGWKIAVAQFPDLIVSDIMMPQLNGLDLCRKLKSDQRTSHIPVILLTARTSEEQKLEGFETGADEYINKPFNFEILESRIRNLIAQRKILQKNLSVISAIKATELNITPLDEQFLKKVVKQVEDNVANADFSVEDLCHEMGISRAHFYKKIMALTGRSPLEFIRHIRLQQAAQLLEKSQLTVAEVAYRVGFNNPKYFTKYFKEIYHVLPSAYAAGKRR
jgi:signal transduction histidine kinase/ligand-binding sensor domain-containing protein/DNA-binding response OmpR family regulator